MIIYLGYLLPDTSRGSLETKVSSTALHASKDLAVSPSLLPRRLFPKPACALPHADKEPCCFRIRRLCSHLSCITCDGNYPLPFLISQCEKNMSGLSSTNIKPVAIIVCRYYAIFTQKNKFFCVNLFC